MQRIRAFSNVEHSCVRARGTMRRVGLVVKCSISNHTKRAVGAAIIAAALNAQAAHAFGPVSMKLEDINVEQVACEGEMHCLLQDVTALQNPRSCLSMHMHFQSDKSAAVY